MNIAFFIAYTIMGIYFSIEMHFQNQMEQVVAYFVNIAFYNIWDKIFYIIAFAITGRATTNMDNPGFRSAVHWVIRVILMIILILVANTEIFADILTPITHQAFVFLREFFKETSLAPLFDVSI